ncbi:VOC family protein [Mammaliicoccus sciuri]|uniref:VOC family protein n=1 Tax=Mammaliicoccus sciuri TaxID=1296 RepID=UPI000D1E5C36|nr:VOC family protein [Mammaliicoccus sciuri]PTK01365.1 glyoxalase/bleomycin resistance/extradiol dioxygenase family protein [Mammaliicoccus sciuri]
MKKLSQVMIYVDGQEKAVDFWTEVLNFVIISEETMAEGFKALEVAPSKQVETSLSIIEKEFMEKYSPEVNLGTPSLMFKEEKFDELYEKLKEKDLTGHDVIDLSGTRIFNFHDGQGNYFAVSD